jgi:hypothetical protein
MDLVNITDPALGLANTTVRITEIEEDDNGLLWVTAEEFPAGIATPVQYPIQTGGGNSTNQNVVPARVNPPIIFEPPASHTGGIAKVYIAASGGVATACTLAETGTAGQHYTTQALQWAAHDSLRRHNGRHLLDLCPGRDAQRGAAQYLQRLGASWRRLQPWRHESLCLSG